MSAGSDAGSVDAVVAVGGHEGEAGLPGRRGPHGHGQLLRRRQGQAIVCLSLPPFILRKPSVWPLSAAFLCTEGSNAELGTGPRVETDPAREGYTTLMEGEEGEVMANLLVSGLYPFPSAALYPCK